MPIRITTLINALTLCALLTACADAPSQAVAIPAPAPIAAAGPCCGPITPAARRVLKVLADSNLENLWPDHRPVEWNTGEPTGPLGSVIHNPETHCSLFAAAMGARLGVYMPRPPQFSQNGLSSAQIDYFNSNAGRDAGWYQVSTQEQAQALANQGKLVVAGFHGSSERYTRIIGHVAIVRASARTEAEIRDRGVLLSSVGGHNHLVVNLKTAFASHPVDEVHFYAHDVPQAVRPDGQSGD